MPESIKIAVRGLSRGLVSFTRPFTPSQSVRAPKRRHKELTGIDRHFASVGRRFSLACRDYARENGL